MGHMDYGSQKMTHYHLCFLQVAKTHTALESPATRAFLVLVRKDSSSTGPYDGSGTENPAPLIAVQQTYKNYSYFAAVKQQGSHYLNKQQSLRPIFTLMGFHRRLSPLGTPYVW